MNTLKRQLKKFNNDVKKRVNFFKINLSNQILWELVNDTPVDTSKAISNWIVSLHKAHNNIIKAHRQGTHGSTASISTHLAFMIGVATNKRAKIGETIYITNNVDYIHLLNMGYSIQADPKFIEQAVENGVNKAKGLKI